MTDVVTLRFVALMTIVVLTAILMFAGAITAGEYRSVLLVCYAVFCGVEVNEGWVRARERKREDS